MRIFVFIVLFLFLVFAGNTIFAGISVSTGAVETAVFKGKEVVQSFKVTNPGNSTARVDIGIVNFSEKEPDPSTWLIVEPADFELKAGESREVFCRIKSPSEAEGELRARIYISGNDLNADATSIGVRFNMPVYAVVQNTIKLGAGIDEINVKYNIDNKMLEGDVSINNTGNVHIRPEVRIIIKDLKDNLIGNVVVPFGQPVQRDEGRMFIFKETIGLSPGRYRLTADVDYGSLYGLKDFIVAKEIEFEIKK